MWKSKYPEPLPGTRFDEWTVIEDYRKENKKTSSKLRVRCSCGVEKDILINRLLHGGIKSCGHVVWKSKYPEPLPGTTFHDWTVIEDYRKLNKRTGDNIRVRCSCGSEEDITIGSLIRGDSKSCVDCRYARSRGTVKYPEPLPGTTFNDLTVIEDYRILNKTTPEKIRVRCSCGIEKNIRISELIYGTVKSCGHRQFMSRAESVRKNKHNYINRVGEMFDTFQLTAYKQAGNSKHTFTLTCKNGHDIRFENTRVRPAEASTRKTLCWCQETHPLKRLRQKKGITMRAAGQKINVTGPTVKRYENRCITYGKQIASMRSDRDNDDRRRQSMNKLKESHAFKQLCKGYDLSADEQHDLLVELSLNA